MQIVKTMIVSGDNVVAVGSDSIAFGNVMLRLAQTVRTFPDLGSELWPVRWKSAASVAAVPVGALP
ncbi:hypothetical protein BLI708_00305 [Bifidobacterium imperatoris]|uniref:Uncharacterized protein n=1 Tax=Bifidobacterium imperatoris TaxID=2020965 RepID=A0ABX7S2C9_9BIFI|nr:hypothetical protein [Bifidobacterium imperatoris]QSY57822.1 hypothetical protein BLI708_00305 [Bifidobacterium imperatoris]